jgi:pimeloyl-ACP methyl ester carboxylesterase
VDTTTSADGTRIAHEVVGAGPPVVIVTGAFCDRASPEPLARLLSAQFRVVTYDRRGRGDSGDTPPYAVAREIDDLVSVIDAAGGDVMIYGHSSGAILALEAAAAGARISRLAVYEPPYVSRSEPAVAERIRALAASGDRSGAAEAFLRLTGMPDEIVAMIQASPGWPHMLGLAHTLPYDLAITGDATVPVARFSKISIPTLVANGGASPDEMRRGAATLAAALPGAQHVTCEGQGHAVDHRAVAPLLIDFFTALQGDAQ